MKALPGFPEEADGMKGRNMLKHPLQALKLRLQRVLFIRAVLNFQGLRAAFSPWRRRRASSLRKTSEGSSISLSGKAPT